MNLIRSYGEIDLALWHALRTGELANVQLARAVDFREQRRSSWEWLEVPIVVPSDSKGTLAPPALRQAPQAAATDSCLELLSTEVFLFCVVPDRGWQERARLKLPDYRDHWIRELGFVQERLGRTDLAAVSLPFGRFDELANKPEQWVPEIASVHVPAQDLAHGVDSALVEIYYLRRPYILWPTYQAAGKIEKDNNGSPYARPIHKTRVHYSFCDGQRIHIARPTLDRLSEVK